MTNLYIISIDAFTQPMLNALQTQWNVSVIGKGVTEKHDLSFLILQSTGKIPEALLTELDQQRNVLDYALFSA